MLKPILVSTLLAVAGPSGAAVIVTDSIPFTDDEVVNPDRGFFTWHGENVIPQPRRCFNTYNRYLWRKLEPQQGVYDFTPIERDLDSAKARGQKHGFRVMAVNDWEWNPALAALGVPPYVKDQNLGVSCPPKGAAVDSIFVPAWNDPAFLKYLIVFIDTLGARYNGDRRIAYIDMGFYGHWGEWHLGDLCGPRATLQTKKVIIDAMIAAFPDTRLLMVPDEGEMNEKRGEALSYAMQRNARIGLRKDNLADGLAGGGSWFEQEIEQYPLVKNAVKDRWRTAPFVTEFIGWANDISLAEGQVRKYHVSSVGNGNIYINHEKKLKWESVMPGDRALLTACGKAAGYRLLPDSVSLVPYLRPGHPFDLVSWWSNRGSAPVYEPWRIVWELRSTQGSILWKDTSSLDIRRVMPDSSRVHSDECSLPPSLKAQAALLRLTVVDSAGYFPPLQLAIRGAESDGAYRIGTVLIEGTTSARIPWSVPLTTRVSVRRTGGRLTLTGLAAGSRARLVRTDGRSAAVGRGPTFSATISSGLYLLETRPAPGSASPALRVVVEN